MDPYAYINLDDTVEDATGEAIPTAPCGPAKSKPTNHNRISNGKKSKVRSKSRTQSLSSQSGKEDQGIAIGESDNLDSSLDGTNHTASVTEATMSEVSLNVDHEADLQSCDPWQIETETENDRPNFFIPGINGTARCLEKSRTTRTKVFASTSNRMQARPSKEVMPNRRPKFIQESSGRSVRSTQSCNRKSRSDRLDEECLRSAHSLSRLFQVTCAEEASVTFRGSVRSSRRSIKYETEKAIEHQRVRQGYKKQEQTMVSLASECHESPPPPLRPVWIEGKLERKSRPYLVPLVEEIYISTERSAKTR